MYGEEHIFDTYDSIFNIKGNQKFSSDSPLDSMAVHKLAYIIHDKNFEVCSKVQIYPYLHERKIYLNRIKINTQYFYTAMLTPVSDQISHNNRLI